MDAWGQMLGLVTDARVGPLVAGTGLASARLYATVRVVPFLGGRRVHGSVHVGLALALGLAMAPDAGLDPVPAAPLLVVLLVKEVLVGFALGLLASLPFRFLEQTGVLVDATRTTNLSSSPVASGTGATTPTGNLLLLGSMAVFFLTPAHRLFWTGIATSFAVVPVAPGPQVTGPDWSGVALAAIASSGGLFAASVLLAFPVLLSVLVTDLSIGAAGRFVRHSGGTFTFMPLRSAVGLLVLALALAVIVPVMGRILVESMGWLEAIR